jgi:hypothetical protein
LCMGGECTISKFQGHSDGMSSGPFRLEGAFMQRQAGTADTSICATGTKSYHAHMRCDKDEAPYSLEHCRAHCTRWPYHKVFGGMANNIHSRKRALIIQLGWLTKREDFSAPPPSSWKGPQEPLYVCKMRPKAVKSLQCN